MASQDFANIGLDHGGSPVWHQVINWISVLVDFQCDPQEQTPIKFESEEKKTSKNMFEMSSARFRAFLSGLNILKSLNYFRAQGNNSFSD